MKKLFLTMIIITMLVASTYAVSIIVAPVTGTPGGNPTNTIADAITQVNAGADATNTITLKSTEGPHILPASSIWTVNAGKNVDFVAESGRPIIRLSSGGQYNLIINNSVGQTVTFTGIDFIPQAGQTYAGNVNDGIRLGTNGTLRGSFSFTDCIFSYNDGSNGVGALIPFVGTNCVGDDWLEVRDVSGFTLSNCLVTGCNDDAILMEADVAAGTVNFNLTDGTAVCEVGGAGIQVVSLNTGLVLDGSGGRVQVANCGLRPASNDVCIKFFGDTGCSLTLNKADIIGSSNGLIGDYEGVPTINITDSRLAFGNSQDVGAPSQGILGISDESDDSAYTMIINITRATFHDCLGVTNPGNIIVVTDFATDPSLSWTIIDSIFSGAGDTFTMLGNAPSLVTKSFTAVVQAGPHTVAAVGDMGVGSVSADPMYVSLSYTVGRSQDNGTFLLPTNDAAYATANSLGGYLRGGCTVGLGIDDWSIY